MDIQPVEDRAADARLVLVDLLHCARAIPPHVSEIAAGAWLRYLFTIPQFKLEN
jgi:hypothetical protein